MDAEGCEVARVVDLEAMEEVAMELHEAEASEVASVEVAAEVMRHTKLRSYQPGH